MSFELALHAWVPGQLLTPGHFERQEQVLLAHMAARFRLSGLPAYGLAALELEPNELQRNCVKIRKLEWMLQDGTWLSTRGNVEPIEPLQVQVHERVPVYAAVLPPRELSAAAEASQVLPRCFRVKLLAGHPPWAGEEESGVLSREQSMQLLTLEPARGGRGVRLGGYVPPLLHVCTTPFLRAALLALYESIGYANESLAERSRGRAATGARFADVQRRVVQGKRLRAILREGSIVHDGPGGRGPLLHPYELFAHLRDYACELALAPGSPIDPELLVYDHDDLERTFRVLIEAISGEASDVPGTAPTGLSFEREGRWFVARGIPDSALDSEDLCFALDGDVRGEELVVASPQRLPTLHERLLPGLSLVPVKFSYAPAGGPDTRYYRVQRTGPEWAHVRRERALCFQRVAGVSLRASLLWKEPDGSA